MFNIKKNTSFNNSLDHIHVYSKHTSCKIFPKLGASIQELIFNNTAVIHGIEISELGIINYRTLKNSALLFPFPGRIQNGKYSHNEQAYQLSLNDLDRFNAIHGLVFDKPFEIDSLESSNENAIIKLSYNSAGKLEGFPFKFEFSITYSISENGLQITFEVKNLDDKSFPFGIGWHPYFEVEDLRKSSLTFYSKKQLICNEKLIPIAIKEIDQNQNFEIENQTFDDTFILSNKKVTFDSKRYTMEMIFSENSDAILQIFTPQERNCIAIEPMTCGPNAFNSNLGLKILQPNETFNWKIDLNISTKN